MARPSKKRKKRSGSTRSRARRRSKFLEGAPDIDYKDHELLRHFMTARGKILPRRITGATSGEQRRIKRAIHRARVLGLLP
jgi:small subunit ribosomal protein S18